MSDRAIDPRATCFHIAGDRAEVIDVDDAFWPDVMSGRRKLDGWLVGAYRFTGNSPHAEVHPEGDEILVLLSGRMDVFLERDGGRDVVSLAPGQACFVPRGTWHWQVAHEESTLLGLTCGRGSQHKPVPV